MKRAKKMNAKNLMVFATLALALFLVAPFVTADVAIDDVTVDGLSVHALANEVVSVVAGEDMTVKVYFTAIDADTDVVITTEIEGEKVSFEESTAVFDVIADKAYKKVLSLDVPYELKDVRNDTLELNIEIDGKEYKQDFTYFLTVQRPSYNADVKSVTVPSSIEAGEMFPVEIVMANIGYNNLDDVYVTAEIAELGANQQKWVGDLVWLEDCDDDCGKEDTAVGKLYLEVPYSVDAGFYTLDVTVFNEDTETTVSKKIEIENDFSSNVIVKSASKTVAKGEEAVYDVIVVNPTNNVKVYTIVADAEFSSTDMTFAVPAGSSVNKQITASSEDEGEFTVAVNVFSSDELEEVLALGLEVDGDKVNSIVVLTIVLAIIFLVLLVVLIVLLGRKPEKAEDFGESYY